MRAFIWTVFILSTVVVWGLAAIGLMAISVYLNN